MESCLSLSGLPCLLIIDIYLTYYIFSSPGITPLVTSYTELCFYKISKQAQWNQQGYVQYFLSIL